MRILIVKLGSIGDVVHTLPALALLRRLMPDARVTWAVERSAAEILRDNPAIDRLVVIDTKRSRRASAWSGFGIATKSARAVRSQIGDLRADDYDVALDFQGLLKSAFVARLSGARRVVGFDAPALREPASRFLYTEMIHVPARMNVIDKNIHLVRAALAIDSSTSEPAYQFPLGILPAHEREAESIIEAARDDFAGADAGFAILNPAGGWSTKLWEPERFGRLANALWRAEGLRSIVTHGPGEAELARRVEAASGEAPVHIAAPSLRGFVALAGHTRVYVGGDTGPTHLAVAAGTPVVGLFGPTEWWRNGSPRAADIVVERTGLACREACHRRACDQWVCMDIDVASALAAVRERLRRADTEADDRKRIMHYETALKIEVALDA